MSEAFETLADRLGRDRLNEYAVEHHLSKEDPGWVGPLQIIPILDAMRDERERIESVAASLSDSMKAAGSEIVRGLADDIAGATVLTIKNETSDDIKLVLAAAGQDIQALLVSANAALVGSLQRHSTTLGTATTTLVNSAHELKLRHETLADFVQSHLLNGAIALLVAFVIGTVGGIACTSLYDRGHLYRDGWNAGAAAVRTSLIHGAH